MRDDYSQFVSEIKIKIRKIITLYDGIKKKNKELEKKNE